MATLRAQEIADLVTGTLDHLDPPKFQQIAQDLQDYEIMSRWLKRDRVLLDHGVGIKRNLMLQRGNNAAHVGLFKADDVNVSDHLAALSVEWRHAQVAWAFETREILMNRGRSLITKIVEPRRAGALIDLAEELELRAFDTPPASTDEVLPHAIPYWIVYNATTGFNGGAPAGNTTVGGINLTTYPNFKNYTANYTTVSKDDLIKKLRTAHRKIRFKSPVTVNDYRGRTGDRYRLYTNETVLNAIETLGEQQNENLGRDIASMDEQIVFKRNPIMWIPKLDDNPVNTDPVYMIDHSSFFLYVLRGDFLRESGAEQSSYSHNVFHVFIDLTYNFVCVDRRRNAILATA